jgi:hypothetical protein
LLWFVQGSLFPLTDYSLCTAGFQLVTQACLAIFFIYILLAFDKKKKAKKKITLTNHSLNHTVSHYCFCPPPTVITWKAISQAK